MVFDRGGSCRWLALLALSIVTLMPVAARELVPGQDWFEPVPEVFPARSEPQAFVHEGEIWVIGGNEGRPISDVWSGGGAHWTRMSDLAFFPREGFTAVSYNGRIWAMGGSKRSLWISGGVWTEFMDEVWSSDDGSSWTKRESSGVMAQIGMRAVEWNGSLWLTGGSHFDYTHEMGSPRPTEYSSRVLRSEDGEHWTLAATRQWFPARSDHSMVEFKNQLFVVGGRGRLVGWESTETAFNDVWSTADGVTWTSATLSAEFSPRYGHGCAVLGDTMWVFGGLLEDGTPSGEAWNSADGIHWTRVVPDPPFLPRPGFTCVVLDGVLWVIGGGDDGLWHTTDGINWSLKPYQHPGARMGHATFEHEGKIWLVGGRGWDHVARNDIWWSIDGASWTRVAQHAAFPPFTFGRVLKHQEKLWLLSDGGLWNSTDATSWSLVSAGAILDQSKWPFVHDGELWIFDQSALTHSPDGVAWTQAQIPPLETNKYYGAASHGEKIVITGNAKRGWYSDDATTWTQMSYQAIDDRAEPEPVVFDGRVWMIGGVDVTEAFRMRYFDNYLSYSRDGLQWLGIPRAKRFPGRSRPGLVAAGEKLFLIGGEGGDWNSLDSGPRSDVWYTYATGHGPESQARSGWIRYE